MKSNYFNKLVTPKVSASVQHTAFADGDVVFGWEAFDIPRGVARVLGATITYRKNALMDQVGCIDLIFAKDEGTNTAPFSVGTTHAQFGAGGLIGGEKAIGFMKGNMTDFVGLSSAATAGVATQTMHNSPSPVILEPNPNSGGNIGVDRYYVAGIASGALAFGPGLVAIGPSAGVDISESNGTFNVIDGTNPLLVFGAGDILHAEDNIIVGEIASLTPHTIIFKFSGETSTNHSGTYTVPANLAAWVIQNGADDAGDLLEDDILYNVFPLKITLHLSK